MAAAGRGGRSSDAAGYEGDGGGGGGDGQFAHPSSLGDELHGGRGDHGGWNVEQSPSRQAALLPAPSPQRPAWQKAWTSSGSTSMEDPMSHYQTESR
jgi:hypothetical protein